MGNSDNVVRYVVHYISQSGGTGHEHITQVYVVDTSLGEQRSGEWWSVEKAHDFVSGLGPGHGDLWVAPSGGLSGVPAAIIYPRTTSAGKKFIQTRSDGIWMNNLLALPVL